MRDKQSKLSTPHTTRGQPIPAGSESKNLNPWAASSAAAQPAPSAAALRAPPHRSRSSTPAASAPSSAAPSLRDPPALEPVEHSAGRAR